MALAVAPAAKKRAHDTDATHVMSPKKRLAHVYTPANTAMGMPTTK
jgi:hypothetical protein